MSSDKSSNKKCCSKTGRRVTLLIIAAVVLGVGTFFGAGSVFAGLAHHGGFAHGLCPLGGEGGKHAEKMVNHIMEKVDGTAEQKAKAQAIIKANAKKFEGRYDTFRNLKDQTVKLLTAKTIDRVALEKLRQEKIKAMDDLSKEMVTVIADIAEVLTPEQRVKLAKLHKDHKKGEKCDWSKKS